MLGWDGGSKRCCCGVVGNLGVAGQQANEARVSSMCLCGGGGCQWLGGHRVRKARGSSKGRGGGREAGLSLAKLGGR